MKIIQAWVYVFSSSSSCETQIIRDFGSIKTAMDTLMANQKALIHIGFHGLDKAKVTNITHECEGNIFATAAAFFCLRDLVDFEDSVVTEIEGLPIYSNAKSNLSIRSPNDASQLSGSGTNNTDITKEKPPWIDAFKSVSPQQADILNELSIEDDEAFLALEHRLKYDDRVLVGKFRQGCMNSEICESSPQDLLHTCPPWVLDRLVSTIGFSVRVANVLSDKNIQTLRELSHLGNSDLLQLPNFGKKSLSDICDVIMSVVDEGPFGDEGHAQIVLAKPLSSHVSQTLGGVSTREADILSKRMGLGCLPHTLDEIGSGYDLTRERIRQIESKAIKKIVVAEYWDDVLLDKVENFQKCHSGPLFFHHFVEFETWASKGFSNHYAIKYLIENFCEDKFTIINFEDLEIISSFSQKKFEETLTLISPIVSEACEGKWPLARFHHEIEGLFPLIEVSLANMVSEHWARKFVTAKNEHGIDNIISYGRGANGLVSKVLEESDTPLHYSNVHEILTEAGHDVDIRRVHNALGDVAYVFGRGTYGLRRHLPLNSTQIHSVIVHVIEQIYSEDEKQWHTSELYDSLCESVDFEDKLSSGIVNAVLQCSEVELSYLGRNVWCRSDGEQVSSADRIDVHQATITIIMDNGAPMSTESLQSVLKKQRGLHGYIQIHPQDQLVRVGRGMWGLLDRDLQLSLEQRCFVLDFLYDYLNKSNKGQNPSQVRSLISRNRQVSETGISSDFVYGLCQLDPRFRTAQGELIGLQKWTGVRCYTLKQASRDALRNHPDGLTLDNAVIEVCNLLSYDVDRVLVSRSLIGVGEYDSELEKWFAESPIDSIQEPPDLHG